MKIMKLERKHALDFALSSSTLSTAQLQLGGSKHLSMPVNLGLSIDFFKFTSMFILGKVKHCKHVV